MTRSSSCGAGGRTVCTGTSRPLLSLHPHSVGEIASPEPFHCCIWQYTRRLWYSVVGHGRYYCMQTSRKVVCIAESWVCLQFFRHINSPARALQQHIQLHGKLTLHRTGLLTEVVACLEFSQKRSLSNSIYAWGCVTSQNSVKEEDVIRYICTKLFFDNFYVPDTMSLGGLLWFGSEEYVMRVETGMVTKQDQQVCVITDQYRVWKCSRFHRFLNNE